MISFLINFFKYLYFSAHDLHEINHDKTTPFNMYLSPNKPSAMIYGDSVSNVHSHISPNSTQSSCVRPIQFYSTQQMSTSSRSSSSTNSIPFSISRNAIDFKYGALPINSSINISAYNTSSHSSKLSPAPTSISSATSYSFLPPQTNMNVMIKRQNMWNSNILHSPAISVNEGVSPYYPPFEKFFESKAQNSNFLKDAKFIDSSSNCSDVNSDTDSFDISDHEKETTNIQRENQVIDKNDSLSPAKKRNPYSIEELLKKPYHISNKSSVNKPVMNSNDHNQLLFRDKTSASDINVSQTASNP